MAAPLKLFGIARGRVERELRPVRPDRHRAHVGRDALQDLRQGIGDDAALAGDGVEVEGASHDHDAEVEGPGDRRGDRDDRERRALVGAGQVGVALDVEGDGPAPAPAFEHAHLRGRRTARRCLLEPPSSGCERASAAAIWASEHWVTPASLASRPVGRVVSILARRWEPSSRVSFSTRGLKAPASGESRAGGEGRGVGRLRPWLGRRRRGGGAEREAVGRAGARACRGCSRGSRVEVVVNGAAEWAGSAAMPASPLKRCRRTSESGSWGFSVKRVGAGR